MRYFGLGLLVILLISSCKLTFSGASISPEVKTVSVDFIGNRASLQNPNANRVLTDELRTIFTQQGRLNLVQKNGDLQIEGYITEYNQTALTIQNSASAENKLTIGVSIKFTNTKEEGKDFEQTFQRFSTFKASQSLASVEGALIEEITKQLAQDVFNKAVINW